MRSSAAAVLDRFRAATTELLDLQLDALEVPELFAVRDATETVRCQIPVVEHHAINKIAAQATPEQIGGSLKKTLAARLRIRPGEARRRIADAEMLGARTALTGEPLAPLWSATAAGQRAGEINTAHLAEIGRFFHQLPNWVDQSVRERAETDLAEQASKFGPDGLRGLADKLADCLNPDGNFTDEDVLAVAASPSGAKTSTACPRSAAGSLQKRVRASTPCSVRGRHPRCAIRPMNHR